MKAISNAGPLIALAKLGQLGLILKLFDEIVIPREVYTEVVTNGLLLGAWDAGSVDFLVRQGHIFVKDVNLPTPIPEWAQAIDMGEAQVILLAFARMPRVEARGGMATRDRGVARRAKTGGFGGVPLGFATDAPRGSAGSFTGPA